jgi:hypothetical protein
VGTYLEGECDNGGDEWEVTCKESVITVVMNGKLLARRVVVRIVLCRS